MSHRSIFIIFRQATTERAQAESDAEAAHYLDEEYTGRVEKFRPCGLPEVTWLAERSMKLKARGEPR